MTTVWWTAIFSCLIGSAASHVRAETVSAQWDTYFYATPGSNGRVIDEVQREAKLDVQSCESGWCRVRYGEAEGYVREEVVHGPANAIRRDGHSNDAICFTASQPGGGTWQSERFCRAGP